MSRIMPDPVIFNDIKSNNPFSAEKLARHCHPAGANDYERWIEGPEWENLRAQALERDGNKCVDCGSQTNLEVHHLHYKGGITQTTLESLVAVCRDCHKKRGDAAFAHLEAKDHIGLICESSTWCWRHIAPTTFDVMLYFRLATKRIGPSTPADIIEQAIDNLAEVAVYLSKNKLTRSVKPQPGSIVDGFCKHAFYARVFGDRDTTWNHIKKTYAEARDRHLKGADNE